MAHRIQSVVSTCAKAALVLILSQFGSNGGSLLISTASAQGVTRNWTGPIGGTWHTAGNWDPVGVPNAADYLILSTGDQPSTGGTVSVADGGRIDINSTANANAGNLRVGVQGLGVLTMIGGSDLTSSTADIGGLASGVGIASLSGDGTSWTIVNDLEVGDLGDGRLVVNSGADVDAGSVYIGDGLSSTGHVTISDSGSTLGAGSDIFIGYNGNGSLEVRNGALVGFAGVANIASLANSQGRLTIDSGGTFTGASSVATIVGNGGDAVLEILGGGTASSNGAVIASASTSVSRALVSGANSLWNLDADGSIGLTVGEAGYGLLEIANGGRVEASSAVLGNASGSDGRVVVHGAGSSFHVQGLLTVGNNDNGTLEISGGASALSQGAVIANNPGSPGSVVTVSGSGSQWNVGGDLVVSNSSSGRLVVDSGGMVTSLGNDTIIGQGFGSGGTVTINGGGSRWSHGGSIRVGNNSNSTVHVTGGGRIDSNAVQLGVNNGVNGTLNLDGAGSRWDAASTFTVGNAGVGVVNITNGAVLTSTSGVLGTTATGVGTVSVTGSGSQWTTSGSLTIGSLGQGNLTIASAGHVQVGGTTSINAADNLTINGGSLTTQSFTRANTGNFNFQGGALTVNGGTFNPGTGTFTINGVNSPATLRLTGNGASTVVGITVRSDDELQIVNGHSLTVGANGLSLIDGTGRATLDGGTLVLQNGANFTDGDFRFVKGVVQLTGGTLLTEGLTVPADGQLNVFGQVQGPVASQPGSLIQFTGTGALIGDSTSFQGVNLAGALSVSTHSVSLQSAGFAQLGSLTTINGGQLAAVNGVALGSGDVLSGRGTVNARVAASTGSLINITDDSTIGNSTAFDGFVSDGNLVINNGAILTVHDRNQANLGALTSLRSDATLSAAEGVIVEFGRVIEGFGTIATPNNPLKPTIINGHVEGDDPADSIILSGYVKGVGTFNNTVFTGTHAPGFSPAAISVGSVGYGSTASLQIELGGLTPGSQFDQINATGVINLDGSLDVSLINGFVPSVGNTFSILTAASSINGEFDVENLPSSAGGNPLAWAVHYNSNSVVLEVLAAAALAGDFNNDGIVDAADYTVWRNNLGDPTEANINFNGNGSGGVDAADYVVWKQHYGSSGSGFGGGGIAALNTTVPEPSALLLLAMVAIAALNVRPRRPGSQDSFC